MREWLGEEPFGLAMSAGYFTFYAHAGVLEALTEADLEPASVSGASAGALVTGLWAAGVEPGRMVEELTALRRADFWDPGFGLGLLKGRLIDAKLRELLPVETFEKCAVPAQMSVTDLLRWRAEVIEEGDLATAIRASCAFPGLIQPVRIGGRPKFDGGIKDWPGLAGVGMQERTLYHHFDPRQDSLDIRAEDIARPRPNLKGLEIKGLPQVTPKALHKGVQAYKLAKTAAAKALELPVGQPVSLQTV
jgi:NTE family protein